MYVVWQLHLIHAHMQYTAPQTLCTMMMVHDNYGCVGRLVWDAAVFGGVEKDPVILAEWYCTVSTNQACTVYNIRIHIRLLL